MSKSLLGLIFALLLAHLSKAEQPIFNITSLNANPGEIIDINFHVNDFSDILSTQFSINWNSDVLEFKRIKNLNTSVNQLTQSSFNVVEPGKITFLWWEPSITPVTLPDGSLLYTLEFEVIGDPCESSPVAITGDPL